jgi:hypothetical protein
MPELINSKILEDNEYELKKIKPIGWLYQDSRSWMILFYPQYSTNLNNWTTAICHPYSVDGQTIWIQEGFWINGNWSVRFCDTLQELEVWVYSGEEE